MADNTQFDFKLLESLGTTLLCSIEEEFVSMTYGITRLLKQGFEMQRQNFSTVSGADRANGFDSMMNQMTNLMNQFEQRNQSMPKLESRLADLESTIKSSARGDYHRSDETATALDIRLTAIEDSLNSMDLLATELGQQGDRDSALGQRLAKLEELLQSMSNVPELLGHQSQAIANLEDRMTKLESVEPADNDVIGHAIESDRAV